MNKFHLQDTNIRFCWLVFLKNRVRQELYDGNENSLQISFYYFESVKLGRYLTYDHRGGGV